MRIAFFYFLKFGGAKRVVMDQVRSFRDAGIEVDVFTINHEKDFFDPSQFANFYRNYIFKTKYLTIPIVGKFLYFYYVLISLKNLQKKIARDIDSRGYNIIIVHPDMYTQAPYLLRFIKTKSVYYSQEPYRIAYEHSMRIDSNLAWYIRLFEHIKRYLIKIEDRKNVKSASHIITSSLSVRERMIQSYDAYPKVCPPGIDIETFKARGFKKKKVLLFVGSKTDRIDGFDLLTKALQFFPKSKKPKIKFVTWKKDNNRRITEKELAKIYETSYVTMCMSRFETFGLIPLESMACGTPVIATNIGGHRESVVNNVTGFLVDPDPKEIFEKINLILNTPIYNQFSKASQSHIQKNWTSKKRNAEFISQMKKYLI